MIKVTEKEATEAVNIVHDIASQAFSDGNIAHQIVLDTGTTTRLRDWYFNFMGVK